MGRDVSSRGAGDGWMVIGVVAGAFGVRGEMKVGVLTDYPDRFNSLERVFLGRERTAYAVEGSRRHGDRVLLKLAGIDTPEAVTPLRETEIAVPRTEAVALPEGHYFLDDVIGIEVETTDGRVLGKVTDVLRTGSNDVYVIGSGSGALLVPAVRDAVAELDVPTRRLVVQPWVTEPAL